MTVEVGVFTENELRELAARGAAELDGADAAALLAGTAGTTITNRKQPFATPLPEQHTTTARKSA